MAEPVQASTVLLAIGFIILILGILVSYRPDTWVAQDIGAMLLLIWAVVLIIFGGFLRWGGSLSGRGGRRDLD